MDRTKEGKYECDSFFAGQRYVLTVSESNHSSYQNNKKQEMESIRSVLNFIHAVTRKKAKELQFLSDSSSISFKLSHAGFAPPFHEDFYFHRRVRRGVGGVSSALHF
ncbi:hypothetical protein CEXT_503141 [Caerostris extrusa]|uniref:Uncharacterized protein n=1 Tax=Caerostris extrusa TaxID=172846 RepID=A0AAV4SWA2_CAEEX|nr:hypothetical protein CEXT_503141 [Caerostris extrusa]